MERSPAGTRITLRPGSYEERRDVLVDKYVHIVGCEGAVLNGNIVVNVSGPDASKTERYVCFQLLNLSSFRVVIENLTVVCSKNTSAVSISCGSVFMISCAISGEKVLND